MPNVWQADGDVSGSVDAQCIGCIVEEETTVPAPRVDDGGSDKWVVKTAMAMAIATAVRIKATTRISPKQNMVLCSILKTNYSIIIPFIMKF